MLQVEIHRYKNIQHQSCEGEWDQVSGCAELSSSVKVVSRQDLRSA